MRRVALLVALVLGAGLLSAPPAASAELRGGAVFNVPPPWGTQAESYRIIKHVEAAIRAVPAGPRAGGIAEIPEILVTTYLLDRKASIEALIDACERGVSVRVIIDKGIETRGSIRLARALNGDNVTDDQPTPQRGPCNTPLPTPTPEDGGGDLTTQSRDAGEPLTDREAVASIQADLANKASWGTDGSYLTQCTGSCRGGRGSMHTKFYAFSHTGRGADMVRDVVMVSSSNLNIGGAEKGWNDLFTMKRVPATYAGYEQTHNEMGEDRRLANGYREIKDGPFTSRFFPMSNGTKANDPTLDDLNHVRCRSDFGRTKINIAMFYWQGARGHYLLDRVLELARQKCRVNIIIGAPSLEIAKRMRAASRARLIKVWDSRHWTKRRVLRVRTHNKYVAIKGAYRGDRSAQVVMTGSQNWGHGSLDKSDDSTLNVALPGAYNQYFRHWGRLQKHSFRMAAP